MKNYGIIHLRYANIDNFTSNVGMNLRKKINPALRKGLKLAAKTKIVVDNYPKLNKDEAYIFVSLHGFVDDAVVNLATIDRNAYVLFGTTDQLEVNKQVYAAWLNGLIYVDRNDKRNRQDAIKKMERVLNNGNSVLIYAEGGLNNTENLLCQKLFASPYILSKSTNCKVVPIAPLYEFGSDCVYINVGEPIDLTKYANKNEALRDLRDILSTLQYENIEKHTTPVIRKELGEDPRLDFMEQRRQEYLKTKWTKDVWDEELTQYLSADDIEYNAVLDSYENIKITKKNADLVAPILVKKIEKDRYDFKKYMHENWNK